MEEDLPLSNPFHFPSFVRKAVWGEMECDQRVMIPLTRQHNAHLQGDSSLHEKARREV